LPRRDQVSRAADTRHMSSLNSANKFHPEATPSEKRKVAGSIPTLATRI
jgi:hypothetical protein